MFNHALAKCGLFLAVAAIAAAGRSIELKQLGGLARAMPWTFGALVVCGLSLIGIPGTAGFVSKWYLITAVLDHGTLGIVSLLVIVAGSLMAVVYVWKIVEAASFGEAEQAEGGAGQAPPLLIAVLWTVAVMNIYFGIRPEAPVELATRAADILLAHVL
ncbi:MAG: proton-conducting transporter membrane subunit, partial [Pseudomonadota bacterium]